MLNCGSFAIVPRLWRSGKTWVSYFGSQALRGLSASRPSPAPTKVLRSVRSIQVGGQLEKNGGGIPADLRRS
jgi:hypothetical protein